MRGATRLPQGYLFGTPGWKQSREATGRPDSSFGAPGGVFFLGACKKGQGILQQLKSADLGEEVAKNTIPASLKQVTYLFLFIKLLVVRERPFFLLKIKKLYFNFISNVSIF